MRRGPVDRWGAVAQWLHWTIVLLIVVMAYLGLTMVELPNTPKKVEVYALHKSFGLTVLALVVLRLAWRLLAGTPLPEPMPAWQALAARLSHVLLYAVLVAMPLTGWLYTSASGFPLRWFGQFALPKLSGRDRDVAGFAVEAHETLFLVLAALVTVHALAALKHHYLDRDRTLRRMLPAMPPPPPRAAAGPLAED